MFSHQPAALTAKKFPQPLIISLDRVEELRRVSRTDRYLEFGATFPLQRILQLGTNILPPPLRSCLHSIGTPGLRRLATIGGNLMLPESSIALGLVIGILDGTLEIRRSGGSRRIPVSRFINSGRNLQSGEILTRIRIPNRFPTHAAYQCFGSPYARSSHPLGICGIAYAGKAAIESFQFATATSHGAIVRDRELEADIIDQRSNMSEKEMHGFAQRWQQRLQQEDLSTIQIERSVRIFLRFLLSLSYPPQNIAD